MSDQTINTTVTAEEILPIAKKCLAEIEIYRQRQNSTFVTNYMKKHNGNWFNRLTKQTLKSEEATIEYLKDQIKDDPDSHLYEYPDLSYYLTKRHAREIIYNCESAYYSHTYVMPIGILNKMIDATKLNEEVKPSNT